MDLHELEERVELLTSLLDKQLVGSVVRRVFENLSAEDHQQLSKAVLEWLLQELPRHAYHPLADRVDGLVSSVLQRVLKDYEVRVEGVIRNHLDQTIDAVAVKVAERVTPQLAADVIRQMLRHGVR